MEQYYDYGTASYRDGTEALNLELFEKKLSAEEEYLARRRAREREQEKKQRAKIQSKEKLMGVVAKVKSADRAATIKLVAAVMVGLAIITTLVMSSAQNYNLMLEINEKEEQLASLEHKYEALELEFDTKLSKAAIEEYAVSELNMQKRENSQTEWINLGSGDVYEYTGGKTVLVQLRDWMAGLGN